MCHGCLTRVIGMLCLCIAFILFIVGALVSLYNNDWKLKGWFSEFISDFKYGENVGGCYFFGIITLVFFLIMVPYSYSKAHAKKEAKYYVNRYIETEAKVAEEPQQVGEYDMSKLRDTTVLELKELADYWYRRATE